MTKTLIIGQGIAGSLLALELRHRNQDILVVDFPLPGASTSISSGMMNPITGKRLVLQIQDQHELNWIITYYRQLEQQLNVTLLHQRRQYRCFTRTEEQIAYDKKRHITRYAPFLNTPLSHATVTKHVHCKDAGFQLDAMYQLDTVTLLQAVRTLLRNNQQLEENIFSYEDLHLDGDQVFWQGGVFDRVVFCEGWRGKDNPFFPELVFENAKGDILDIDCPELPKNTIFNHGHWLAPSPNGRYYRYGTNSIWEFDHCDPDPETASTLEQDLQKFLKHSYTIKAIQSGVRPVLKEREPVFKPSTVHPKLWIVNGLGGQGCFRTPKLLAGQNGANLTAFLHQTV